MDKELIKIEATIDAVVFRNNDNGYAVLRLQNEDGDSFTAVGCMPRAGVGEFVVVSGVWINHPSYGEQFKIEFCERSLPATEGAILEYLSSGTIRGIGRKTAERIVAAFGAETFNIIENDAAQLATIPGITHSKAVSISNDFKTQNGISRLMEFLVSNELPPSLALHLYRLYGAASIELLHDNPYLLTNMELGVEFYRADKLAMTLGLSGDCMERVEAAVVYELSYNAESGHVFIPRRKLVPVTAKLIDVPYDLVEDTIDSLSDDHVIVIEDVCGETACYLSHLYEAETFVAARLEQLMGCQIKTELDMGETVSRIESAARLSYAPLQREAVCAAANNPVMILTGGPGTGKTTVIQGMLELFSRMGLSVSLAAPTGRAAKRMSEFCGVEAATIHRMLEQDYTDGSGLPTFGKNEGNPLETDVLIIDEMSMVDIMLMRAVLAALPTSCRLVMVGDSDQLPSIGAGNVLKDLIAADIITSIRLTEIFRQAQSSNIVVSAHAINRGEFPDFAGRDSDMFFLQRHDANSVIETTVELCRDRLPKNMGIPASQIQVLTPSRKYDVGTIILNRRLQDALNPASQDKNEHRVGDKLFRVGDRVMQIRNNYDLAWHNLDGADSGLGVFNGDIGEIIAIDANVELLSVQYDERVVHYAFTMLCELELAYAMTVHKAQGSEFRAVVFAALGGSDFLLHRSVLYTAITRARSLLVLVSDKDTIKTMISNNRQRNRYTALRYRIVAGLGGV